MEKISRYILVFVAILSFAVVLPKFYWMAFGKPMRVPFVQYSCVNKDFMIHRISEKKWIDTKGNEYTREEYEEKLPMLFTKQLLASGTMPDSINGIALDMRAVSKEKSFFRLRASEVDAPRPDLFPLFESRSGRAQLELPEDFFRINWRIDFIDATTNTIVEEKSQLFSAALFRKGFSFPAKIIAGIPTPRKSCDEGYLIIDSKDQLFHLKMIKSKPFVHKVDLPEDLKFRHIGCVDNKNKAFYAFLISAKNEIYILEQDNYSLLKWPVEGYNAANCDLKIYGDFFNYTAIIEAKDHLKAIVLDKHYQFVDSYTEKWPVREESREGRIFASIFPAQLSLTHENSTFLRFYFTPSKGYNWIFLNLLFLTMHLIWLIKRKSELKNHFADLGIVALTGIFGFIAIHFFQNKFYE